jgi:transcriptional regulator with XRE-family HTH domain
MKAGIAFCYYYEVRSSGELLRAARVESALTQTELAARTGVPQSLISAYERGRRQPGADMLLRLLAGTGHEVVLRSSLAGSREAADKLAQVVALASALPVRAPGPLRYPSFTTLGRTA